MRKAFTTRVLAVLLAAVLTAGCLPFAAEAAATTDMPAPASVSVSAAAATAPGSVEVVVDAADDVSGTVDGYVYFRCAQTGTELSCWISGEYYDQENKVYTAYPDGKLHGMLTLNRYIPAGDYVLYKAELYDRAGNRGCYTTEPQPEAGSYAMPQALRGVRLAVSNANAADVTAPEVSTLSLSSGSVAASASVRVTALAEDDLSGVEKVWVVFANQSGMTLSCTLDKSGSGSALYGSMSVSAPTGTYTLQSVQVRDRAGNLRVYADSPVSGVYQPLTAAMKALKLVVGGTADTTLPVLRNVTLLPGSLTEDGSLEVVVDALDAGSGLNYGYVSFSCGEHGKTLSCQVRATYFDYSEYRYKEYPDGKLHGTLRADPYLPSGSYKLDTVNLYDNAGNCHTYTGTENNMAHAIAPLPVLLRAVRLEFTNRGKADVTPPKLKSVAFVGEPLEEPSNVARIQGADRYETALKTADVLKQQLGWDKFSAVVVASGTQFADALSGCYLASVKKAPILLVRDSDAAMDNVKAYIRKNLAPGGTVYLLGGINAVPKRMEAGLSGFTVKRLGGEDRYATNLLILEEAGALSRDILVCTGRNFADSLSAAAAGLPILLVKEEFTAEQEAFLNNASGKFFIIGGTAAVSAAAEAQLSARASVKRLGGNSRYETSVLVAEEFFREPAAAVLAYARNFPDGLSGGVLASIMGAPLLLVNDGNTGSAAAYGQKHRLAEGFVLGGPGLISDGAVRKVFSLTEYQTVPVK